jgi:dTDP-glucose 4,6-dehydratase
MGLLVVGGAGFLGSHFIKYLVTNHGPKAGSITCLDLNPPGRLLKDFSYRAFRAVQGDISTPGALEDAMGPDTEAVVNFADAKPSGHDPFRRAAYLATNVEGIVHLLEASRRLDKPLVHVSTAKVYGSVPEGSAREVDALRPRSLHAAARASAEHLIEAYHATYGVPVKVVRPGNAFGPHQSLDHLVPHFITSALKGMPLLVYGDGLHVRDRIHVEDVCSGIDFVLHRGRVGEAYNVGTGKATAALEVAKAVLEMVQQPLDLITFMEEPPAVIRRVSLATLKVQALGWRPRRAFGEGLWETIKWYEANLPLWEVAAGARA